MGSEKFVKKVYVTENVDPNNRGRPPGRWRDTVKEYMCERGATRRGEGQSKQRESVWTAGGGDFSAALGDIPRGIEASEL